MHSWTHLGRQLASYLPTYLPIIIVNIFAMLLLYVYVVGGGLAYVTNVERICCPTPLIKKAIKYV